MNPETRERLSITTSEVNESNEGVLANLRVIIDGVRPERIEKEIKNFSSTSDRRAFIAQGSHSPVGYVETKIGEIPEIEVKDTDIQELGHLARIGVVTEARGQVVGKQLLQVAEEWLKLKGKKGVWLDYRADNEDAKQLYSTNGYVDLTEFTDKKNLLRRIAIKEFDRN